MGQPLAEIAQHLYGLAPSEFTAARNERAARAKAEGETALATQIRGLAKPTVAAWVVNLLVRHLPERLDQLIALGEGLQEAQDSADAATLRELTKQRRRLTAAIADEATDLAQELGAAPSAAVTEQVQATLTAAMLDPDAAAALRSGTLLAALGPDGEVRTAVGAADPGAAEEARSRPADLAAKRAEAKAKAAKEATEAKREIGTAQTALERTSRVARAHKEKVRALQAEVLQVRAELDELLREVSSLEDRLEPLTGSLASAQDAAAEAEAMTIAAEAALERAKQRLARATR